MKYYINVISRDHVQRGVAGNFTQAGHGKPHALQRLKTADWLLFYSSKTAYENGVPLQAFTALGQVKDEVLYQVDTTSSWAPWRRNVTFHACIETPIKPLLGKLSFILDKTHWGYVFRSGFFEIPAADFDIIRHAMMKQ